MKLIIAIALCMALAGCAGTTATGTAQTTITKEQAAQYLNLAIDSGIDAIVAYGETQNMTDLEKAVYWSKYAKGIRTKMGQTQ